MVDMTAGIDTGDIYMRSLLLLMTPLSRVFADKIDPQSSEPNRCPFVGYIWGAL